MFHSDTSPLKRYILAWLGLPLVAVFNGILRDLTYGQMFGDHLAHQVSSVILSTVIVLYVFLLNTRLRLRNSAEALRAGFAWLAATIVFEFVIGMLLRIPLSSQLAQYNPVNGNLWVLVLLTVFWSPLLFRRFSLTRHAG